MSSPVMASPRSDDDPVAHLAVRGIGGPRGRYSASRPTRTAVARTAAVLSVVAALTMAVGFLQKSYCLRFGWGAPQVYWKACYSDLPLFAGNTGLAQGNPYSGTTPVAYPVGTGWMLRLLEAVVPDAGFARQQGFFVAWAVLATILVLATVSAVAAANHRHPSRAAHVAFAPVLATTALVSVDLAGIALSTIAVWLWSRRSLTGAGVLFGLAIVTRTPAVLVLLVVGLLALRAGALREWARTAGVAIVTAVAVLAGTTVLWGMGTLLPYRSWVAQDADLGSTWYLVTLTGTTMPAATLTLMSILGWVVALTAGLLLALGAPVRPRIGEVAVVVMVLVLLTGKVLPIQASLWLVPLVALAGLRWRDHLLWATTEVLAFVAVWLYFGGQNNVEAALPLSWYTVFLVLRLIGIAWLGVAAARQILRRRPTPDATVEVDDAAGPMTDRHDAVVVHYAR